MCNKESTNGANIDIAIFPGSLSRGGAERVSVRLAGYFASQGLKIALVVGRQRQEGDYSVPGNVDFYCVSHPSGNYFSAISQYRKIVKMIRPKTIIVMGTPLCCTVVPAALFTGSKIIVSERNSPKQFAGKKTTKILKGFWMRFANGYVFQTEQAKQYYGTNIQKKATVIPNPIIVEEIPERKPPFQKEVVGVGRLNPQKNWPLLIRAFSEVAEEHPEWKLVIYGEGNERQRLEQLIAELHMEERISLPGVVDDILERERNASIFVMTSNFEGMPNALMEAMAIGLPCIATDCPCGGPAELIENGRNGILVSKDDIVELSSSLKGLINNSDIMKNISAEATKVCEIYNMARIGERWLAYYRFIKNNG